MSKFHEELIANMRAQARKIAERTRVDAGNRAAWLDDTQVRDGSADNLADLAAVVLDIANSLASAPRARDGRLWLVTGSMVGPGQNHIVGSLFTAGSAEEALGLLLDREQRARPGLRAEAFKALDCTDAALDFARHPK